MDRGGKGSFSSCISRGVLLLYLGGEIHPVIHNLEDGCLVVQRHDLGAGHDRYITECIQRLDRGGNIVIGVGLCIGTRQEWRYPEVTR